jgi:hypothetical protein
MKTKHLLMAAITLALPAAVHAAPSISLSYVSGQEATNSIFTTGLTTVDLSGATPTVSLVVGSNAYLRFGIAGLVTGNSNPASSTDPASWDVFNQAQGNPAQPTSLGLASFAFIVQNSNGAGLAPLGSGVPARSTLTFNSTLNLAVSDKGVIDTAAGSVGNVGTASFPISGGVLPGNVSTDTGPFTALTLFTNAATNFFTNLKFSALAAGTYTLTPVLRTSSTTFVTNTDPGNAATGALAKYSTRSFGAGDSVTQLPPLTVVVTAPTASTIARIVDLPTVPAVGSELGPVTVPGSKGSYIPQYVHPAASVNKGDLTFNGIDAADAVLIALDVADPATVPALMSALNGLAAQNPALTFSTNDPVLPFIQANDPVPGASYDVLIKTSHAGASPDTFEFDFSGIPGVQISRVAVVPEPAAVGLCGVSALGLLLRRRRRR